MLEHYINDIKKYPPITREEEIELVIKARDGNQLARDQVIQSNLRFVFQVAKAYQGRGLDFEDLLAEGNIGLIKAFDRFDPDRGVKFISYAVWWVRQTILNALYKQVSLVKIPTSRVVAIAKVLEAKAQLEQELAREPSLAELRQLIDDPEALRDMESVYSVVRLDLTREDTSMTLHDVLSDEDQRDEEAWSEDFAETFHQAIKKLTDREQSIIRLYYGIGYVRPHTLREIGVILGLTRERVRQVKHHVLERLKRKTHTQQLREYL